MKFKITLELKFKDKSETRAVEEHYRQGDVFTNIGMSDEIRSPELQDGNDRHMYDIIKGIRKRKRVGF